MKNEKIVCYCSNVSENDIIKAIKNGAKTLKDVRLKTSACTVGKCQDLSPKKRCCSPEIIELIKNHSQQ